jgi:hypothetical protein
MFELFKLIGSAHRELRIDTKAGIDLIRNYVAVAPSARHIQDYRRATRPTWDNRKPACGEYNCFGHVFAARRTSIDEDSEILRIRDEDGYRLLDNHEAPEVDDLVVYTHPIFGFVHVAQAIEVAPVGAGGKKIVARALSKWNDSWGEDYHSVSDVPFGTPIDDFTIEYWTDRPV